MIVYNTYLYQKPRFYPLGNTPAVCLTQDLPPEQEADILLLGCGDARNILFTCFADNARKIDVTCCDIEPMIHARNVLLYTLLIDDKTNSNIEYIWNIYHNWKLDEVSLKLLETQTEKLLQVAESIERWENSEYSSTIRFCDARSLKCIRSYWLGFTAQKDEEKLRAVIYRIKAFHPAGGAMSYCSTFPTAMKLNAYDDCAEVTNEWWHCGVAPSSNSSPLESTHLNPAYLYSPNYKLAMHDGTTPLGGTPLSSVYTSISKGSPFCQEDRSESITKRLVDCAKTHFAQWAIAFRRSVEKRSVLRFFSGDALAFGLTLRNCLLTESTSMNLSCHNSTNSPLILHHRDYGPDSENAAPLSFAIIDTSNLADYVGILNLIVLASSLLKFCASSCLYTELLNLSEPNVKDRLTKLIGVDLCSMAVLLGLVPPDLFTNAMNSVEEYPDIRKRSGTDKMIGARSRLRWRRSGGCLKTSNNSPNVQIKAEDLAKFLIKVYNEMFKFEDTTSLHGPVIRQNVDLLLVSARQHNRASFAFLLSSLKANVFCNWNKCVSEIYDGIFSDRGSENIKEDLGLQMHIFGIDERLFIKPDPGDTHILASVFPECDDLPEQLCVTIRVTRESFKIFTRFGEALAIYCSFQAINCSRRNLFFSPKIVLGKLLNQNKADDRLPIIEEDDSLDSSADMFVSVMVPTSMLISILRNAKPSVPLVKCGFKFLSPIWQIYGCHAVDEGLCFSSLELTSEDVFITRFMPEMSGLPSFASATNPQEKEASNAAIVHLSSDCSKINLLAKRLSSESQVAKTKLVMKSVAKVDFKSPLSAVVRFVGKKNSLNLELTFPVPVSVSKYEVNFDTNSFGVEVRSPLLNPLEEDVPAFLFPCFLMKVSSGIVPAPWTSTRVDLDVMPSLDLKDSRELSWILDYLILGFSKRESARLAEVESEFRMSLKTGLGAFFILYAGVKLPRENVFEVKHVESRLKVFILPSGLRLDFANSTIVLDCALLLLTEAMAEDPLVAQFLQEPNIKARFVINMKEAKFSALKAMLPALVERCRTWKHTPECEYIQAGEVPLSNSINGDELPICSCGIGKFPADYLSDQMEKIPTLSSVLSRYATRVGISPIFSVQYVEDCDYSNVRRVAQKCPTK